MPASPLMSVTVVLSYSSNIVVVLVTLGDGDHYHGDHDSGDYDRGNHDQSDHYHGDHPVGVHHAYAGWLI